MVMLNKRKKGWSDSGWEKGKERAGLGAIDALRNASSSK